MSSNVPILNRVLGVLVSLVATAFFFCALAAGVMAVFGESFLYSNLIIKLFPYNDSIFDVFRGIVRFGAGIWPAVIVIAISNVVISYLTEGKRTALGNLADMRKGFFYQLTHPFSNPRTPLNSSEDKNTHKTNITTIESEQHGERTVKNSVNVSSLNRVWGVLVSLVLAVFFFCTIANFVKELTAL